MIFKQFVSSFMVVALSVTPWLSSQASLAGPTVVINELLWMGSPSSSSDEWIELRNVGTESVDLSGWMLTRLSSGTHVTMLTIPTGASIAAGSFFLIANFSETSTSSELAVAPDLVDPAVSLLNSGLQIRLLDAAANVIDTADDGSGSPLSGTHRSGATYASMSRNGLPGDGTKGTVWHSASMSLNIRAGSLVLGTPRLPNDNVPPLLPILSDVSAIVGEPVSFDATDVVDPDGDSMTLNWEFGDGSSSVEIAPVHQYATAGEFTAKLTASDGLGTSVASLSVNVMAVASVSSPSPSANVIISEVLPNPVGADSSEFIEIFAPESNADIGGWKLSDASGTSFTVPIGTTIASGAYLVFERSLTKIALNNDDDQVTWFRPDGTEASSVLFSGAAEGLSYALDKGTWAWTSKPTPGEKNFIVRPNHPPVAKISVVTLATQRRVGTPVVFDASDAHDPDGDTLRLTWEFGDGSTAVGTRVEHTFIAEGRVVVRLSARDSGGLSDVEEHAFTIKPALQGSSAPKKSGSVKGASIVTSISETRSASSTTPVVVNGWVSAAPGLLGQQLLYMTDGQHGIGVKVSAGMPKLEVGDALTVRGEKRSTSGEAYILVEDRSGLIIGRPDEKKMPEARVSTAESIGPESAGQLVQIEGEVTSLSGARFSLDDGSGEVAAYVKSSAGFKRPAMRSGDRVKVVGIVSTGTSGVRVLPRTLEDISVTVPVRTEPPDSVVVAPTARPPLWGYGLVLVAGIVGYVVATRRKIVVH